MMAADGEAAAELASKCLTAHISAKAYQELVDFKQCGDGMPCLNDECEYCGELNKLIDQLGDECELRGCTMLLCVHDDQ